MTTGDMTFSVFPRIRPHKVKVCLMGARPVALLGIGLGVIEFIPARSASALNRIHLSTLIAGQD